MFPEPARSVLHLSDHFMLCTGAASYKQYTGKTRVQCDECVWVLHEAKGVGELPRSARVRREVTANKGNGITTSTMFLCHVHADLWHKIDGG